MEGGETGDGRVVGGLYDLRHFRENPQKSVAVGVEGVVDGGAHVCIGVGEDVEVKEVFA